jgi:hypothetical protein
MSLRDLFYSKVPDRPATDCWLWAGCRSGRAGYGVLYHDGLRTHATHLSVFLATGEWPPKGMIVCHKCDNPPCVNPDHLFVGTYKDNAQDCVAKGRHRDSLRPNWLRGSQHGQAKLTEDNVLAIRASDERPSVLARKYGVSMYTIRMVVQRKYWRHI